MDDPVDGEELIRIALERYREGDEIRGAAEIADVPIVRMMREANERGVLSNYDKATSLTTPMRCDER